MRRDHGHFGRIAHVAWSYEEARFYSLKLSHSWLPISFLSRLLFVQEHNPPLPLVRLQRDSTCYIFPAFLFNQIHVKCRLMFAPGRSYTSGYFTDHFMETCCRELGLVCTIYTQKRALKQSIGLMFFFFLEAALVEVSSLVIVRFF